jgi:hypothetical protein
MGGRARLSIGFALIGLALVAGSSAFGSSPAAGPVKARGASLAVVRSAVSYWSARVDSDSQLLATRDLQEAEAARALPPCAQTPAVDPPCTGFALATAGGMEPYVEMYGQLSADAQTQITQDQIRLQAARDKLAHAEAKG